MKIVVDISHPAHVHYFKHFIWGMRGRGHDVLITASEKEIAYQLLDLYGFQYVKIGDYGHSVIQKLINVPILDLKMYSAVKPFDPDIIIGFGSIRAAHVAALLRKPYIALDDTEQAHLGQLLYVPFADAILTPTSFKKDFGKNHSTYEGYIELAYLHPRYFSPDPTVLNEIGEEEGSPFVLLRFVAWEAVHDVSKSGFSLDDKIRLVRELERYAHVYISSEGPLPPELESYRITVSPEKIHHVLYYASLFIGDSGTMSTEAALLGTPAIRCSSFVGQDDLGNFIELEEEYGLLKNFTSGDLALQSAVETLENPTIRTALQHNRERVLKEKIDVTGYLLWFVENYPRSRHEVSEPQDFHH